MMRECRVVLDTNILISACWKPDGLEARTLELADAGAFAIFATPEVWAEYREVLGRAKFLRVRDRAVALIHALEAKAKTVQATVQATAALDEDDNRFLECVSAANAGYLVTGNRRHYPGSWGGARVVNARQFLTETFGVSDIVRPDPH